VVAGWDLGLRGEDNPIRNEAVRCMNFVNPMNAFVSEVNAFVAGHYSVVAG
jgi:hypothetical protein